MDSDKMRAEFEVWAEEHNLGITLAAASATGLYTRNLAWTAWRTAYQAGRKAEQAEVERLRGDVDFHSEAFKGLIDYLAEKKAENDKLRAELAAAKAASVCPVELVALGDADWECSVGVKCKSSEDADTLYNWLRDRMKERGEG